MDEEDNASKNVHTDRKKQQPNEEEEETLQTEDILKRKSDIQKLRKRRRRHLVHSYSQELQRRLIYSVKCPRMLSV